MNRQIQDILCTAEGRYLNPGEQTALREFAQTLEARLVAMTEVSGKETVIIERTVKEVLRAYPDLEQRYKTAAQSGTRDMTLVLRYATLAMVRSDPQYLQDTLLTWMATILKGIGFAGHFVTDTYKTLERTALKELSPATGKLLQPFLQLCIESLGNNLTGEASAKVK
ncbi:MAG TPA: hypothetical protein PLW65_06620 [Pseudomonadota bacterium]|nr:hypothetical protein [Pseudomonadota bacterium]